MDSKVKNCKVFKGSHPTCLGVIFCDVIISVYVSHMQSWRLLVVDSCGRADGGWCSWSSRLRSLHWAAPPWAWKTRREQCPRQIWDCNHDLNLNSELFHTKHVPDLPIVIYLFIYMHECFMKPLKFLYKKKSNWNIRVFLPGALSYIIYGTICQPYQKHVLFSIIMT